METTTNKGSKLARRIALTCYPEYKGRKIRFQVNSTYRMADYWDGGSRDYAVAYHLETGRTGAPATMINNPMNAAAHAEIAIPPGFAIVEHSIFCGRDAGITIYVNSETRYLIEDGKLLAEVA